MKDVITDYVDVQSGTAFKLTVDIAKLDWNKHEGTWTCFYFWIRNERLDMKRDLHKTLNLDVPDIMTDPVTQKLKVGTSSVFNCKGRATSKARDINPTYSWTVDGKSSSTHSVNSAGTSELTVAATLALDNTPVKCTVNWNKNSESSSMSRTVTLYTKEMSIPLPAGNLHNPLCCPVSNS